VLCGWLHHTGLQTDLVVTLRYVFEDAELLDRNSTIINVTGGGDYNNNLRQRTRFIRFTLVIRPRDIDTNSKRVTADELPRTVNQSVYLRIIKNNQNRMIDAITRDSIETDLKQLLEVWEAEDEPFDIMMKEEQRRRPVDEQI
jgi:hypothetical protein